MDGGKSSATDLESCVEEVICHTEAIVAAIVTF